MAAGEAGGITQAIGAYTCAVPYEDTHREVTFLDTPGHEVGSLVCLRACLLGWTAGLLPPARTRADWRPAAGVWGATPAFSGTSIPGMHSKRVVHARSFEVHACRG